MYTLDANVFVRNLDPNEPEYETCHALLDQLDETATPIIVPTLVLAEVAGTISRTRRDPIRARIFTDAIRALPHIRLVPLDGVLAQEAAELAADYYLRGADAVYVAVARRHGCTLVSLDVEQRERGAIVVTARSPAAALAELLSS